MKTRQQVGKLIARALKAGFTREVSVTQTSLWKSVSVNLLHRTPVLSGNPWRAIYINIRVPNPGCKRYRYSASVSAHDIYSHIDPVKRRGVSSALGAISRVEQEGAK